MKPDDGKKKKEAKYLGLQLAHKSQQRKPLGLTSSAFEEFVGRSGCPNCWWWWWCGGRGWGGGQKHWLKMGFYLVRSETGVNFSAISSSSSSRTFRDFGLDIL
jgi:hypothetical protein